MTWEEFKNQVNGGRATVMINKIKAVHNRAITPLERLKGRSENYWQKDAQQQWDEDKRLNLLDWDGK